jgi:alpha(1,3/1,4) fucosyltransferase
MKDIIRIDFIDFWPGFIKTDNYFFHLLSKQYTVEFSDNPDYIIYSCFGEEHVKYKCYRIFYCGENLRVNWNACDFAISSDYLQDERYYRLPHWILYGGGKDLIKKNIQPESVLQSKTGFCSFIVGNHLATKRIDFFNKLSVYRQVSSGGRFMNNTGRIYSQSDKMEFVQQYKFTIAFENSSFPGYSTEKIFQAMQGNSIPVYWGDPLVGKDFNTASFINYNDYGSDEAVIEKIKTIDQDDNLYYKMMLEPWYVNNELPAGVREENVLAFFNKIFSSFGRFTPVGKTPKRHFYFMQLKWQKADHILNQRLQYRKNFR